jgi:hypothetical protein
MGHYLNTDTLYLQAGGYRRGRKFQSLPGANNDHLGLELIK